jgi:hypothetical protein
LRTWWKVLLPPAFWLQRQACLAENDRYGTLVEVRCRDAFVKRTKLAEGDIERKVLRMNLLDLAKSLTREEDATITDELLIKTIKKDAMPRFIVSLYTFLMLAFIIGVTYYTGLHNFEENTILAIVITGIVGYYALIILTNKLFECMAAPFAREHVAETVLFDTEVVEIYSRKYNKNRRRYYLIYVNENGENARTEISYSLYTTIREFNYNKITIVRIPKFKKGYIYKAYDIERVKNESCARKIERSALTRY